MAVTERTRQEQKSEDTRRRVRAAAVGALADLGYDRASIKRVVERAAASQGALLHHYPTKIDLMADVAAHLLQRAIRWVRMVGAEPSPDLPPTLRSWREQFRTAEYAALLEILTAARTDEDLRAAIADALKSWHEASEAELSAMFRRAGSDDPRLASIFTITRCLMSGLLVHDALIRDERSVEQVLGDWDAIVRAYLTASGSGGR